MQFRSGIRLWHHRSSGHRRFNLAGRRSARDVVPGQVLVAAAAGGPGKHGYRESLTRARHSSVPRGRDRTNFHNVIPDEARVAVELADHITRGRQAAARLGLLGRDSVGTASLGYDEQGAGRS